MTTPLFADLNEAQAKAAHHDTGPALVIAGAGSGKTKVLTTRVAWLLERGIAPEAIALITFTNKAAQEMNNRVERLTGRVIPFAGTFHRLSARMLRQHGQAISLSSDFVIYDADDQATLIKQVMKARGISTKEVNPNAIKHAISLAKNELISVTEYESTAEGTFQRRAAEVYRGYQKALQEQQAVDFDDLLLLTVRLLENVPQIRARYQEMLKYVLIDEYQDTNKVQYRLTELLASPQNNLFVVGDFAQSIYAWRGADYRNMLRLTTEFPDLVEYRLEQNYRSTQSILDAATAVISQTSEHPILKLWTAQTQSLPLSLFEANSSEEEAEFVINTIRSLVPQYNYTDFVALYRTNAQSRPFEEVLVRFGIPYRVVGGYKFYERKEVKDLLAYLRVLINPQDTVSRQRVEKLGKRRWAAVENWQEDTAMLPGTPREWFDKILEKSQYRTLFDPKDPDDVSRLENIDELLAVASQFDDVHTFLENVALVQDDTLADAKSDQNFQGITLMSLHSAKGLEFPVVFMVGMEEGLLPHSRSQLDMKQLEEERRLCYVGITRAKERLFFSYARQRWIYGSRQFSLRSRFLNDIPTHLLKVSGNRVNATQQYHSWQNQGQSQSKTTTTSWLDHLNQAETKKNKAKTTIPPTRRIVSDDDLDAVLSGELDIQTFLRS